MKSSFKTILIGSVMVATSLAGVAFITLRSSQASAQAQAAKAREAEAKAAQAREAGARAREAAAAKAKEAQAKAAAVAAQARAAAAAKNADPVTLDLSKFLGMKTENFEKIKQYPWPAVPRGSQTFAGVPLEIQGATMLWGQRNADRGLKFPESITGIPCQQKFQTLYILHGAFFEAAKGEPSFGVVLNYEGGEKQTDAVLCGDDTRDWFVKPGEKKLGPSAKRSTLAWTGAGKANDRDQAIRFCLTAIENKYPDRLVETIDLVSSKKQSAGCILAITVGKAGLLKPMPDKPAEPSQNKPNSTSTETGFGARAN